MRSDMFKVIVERPRLRRAGALDAYKGSARIFRNDEDSPAHLGMQRGYSRHKWLNENLSPLKRWLHKQVSRHWDHVYAELAGNIDKRNPVQAHIFAHIDQFVERRLEERDGELVIVGRHAHDQRSTLAHRWAADLYVHPRTGLLLENRAKQIALRKAATAQHAAPVTRHHLSRDVQWELINGVWFEVRLMPLSAALAEQSSAASKGADGVTRAYDHVLKREVGYRDATLLLQTHGHGNVVATAKRQLSTKELRRLKK
jgi:hypothetical protein